LKGRHHTTENAETEPHAEPLSEAIEPSTDPVLSEIEQLKSEVKELQDQLLRSVADMQNMRKRFQQEALQTRQFATEDLVRDLLPILDNFERATQSAEQGATVESVVNGLKAVERQLRSALERRQVVRINAHGEAFDPDLHEAIATDETDKHPEGTVTVEIEPGYRMAEKVIRPARVRVSKKP
jgi:molecular chaperone GrpE